MSIFCLFGLVLNLVGRIYFLVSWGDMVVLTVIGQGFMGFSEKNDLNEQYESVSDTSEGVSEPELLVGFLVGMVNSLGDYMDQRD